MPKRMTIARALGALIGSKDWKGEVLSVHERAVNVLKKDGLVVSLVAEKGGMSAMGVLVPDIFQGGIDGGICGREVARAGPLIRIPAFAEIDLSGADAFEGFVPAGSLRGFSKDLVETLRESLLANGKPGGLLGVVDPRAGNNHYVKKARSALAAGRPEALVGFGPGLTPAGDDFLTGALLASAGIAGRRRIGRAFRDTTPGGRTLLWMALHGRFPAYLLDFVSALREAGAGSTQVEAAVIAACGHGETSGTDALAGFCWGMSPRDLSERDIPPFFLTPSPQRARRGSPPRV